MKHQPQPLATVEDHPSGDTPALQTAGTIAAEIGATARGVRKAAKRLNIRPACTVTVGSNGRTIAYYDLAGADSVKKAMRPRRKDEDKAQAPNRGL